MTAPDVAAIAGVDTVRVFAEMDRYLDEAKAEGFTLKYFRIAEPLLRELSSGTARLSAYRGVPIRCADEWAWGWMLRVSRLFDESWFEPTAHLTSEGE